LDVDEASFMGEQPRFPKRKLICEFVDGGVELCFPGLVDGERQA
jgi:hypothetical protein